MMYAFSKISLIKFIDIKIIIVRNVQLLDGPLLLINNDSDKLYFYSLKSKTTLENPILLMSKYLEDSTIQSFDTYRYCNDQIIVKLSYCNNTSNEWYIKF